MTIEYVEFKCQYIPNEEIEQKAEHIRSKFWGNNIPVNIENIIEKLGIEIIPIPGLNKVCASLDSFIKSDWSAIYIDNDKYQNDNQNRLRFSLGHELGHYVLHKDIYESLNINSLEQYNEFINGAPNKQLEYLEIQANKFSSSLLVPSKILTSKKKKLLDKVPNLKRFDKKLLASYLANPLAKDFQVSAQVIEIIVSKQI